MPPLSFVHNCSQYNELYLAGLGPPEAQVMSIGRCCIVTGLVSVVAERSSALDSSSGVVRMWVRIPAWPVMALVSLSKTLNHNCFVLRMGRKTVGPMCCVMHAKEPRTEKGLFPVFLDSCLEHPAGWICARYKSSVLLLLLLLGLTNDRLGGQVAWAWLGFSKPVP